MLSHVKQLFAIVYFRAVGLVIGKERLSNEGSKSFLERSLMTLLYVGLSGIEPELTPWKGAVLPLDDKSFQAGQSSQLYKSRYYLLDSSTQELPYCKPSHAFQNLETFNPDCLPYFTL